MLAQGRPASSTLPPLALVAALILALATIGVLLLARQSHGLLPSGVNTTPTPAIPSIPGVLVAPPHAITVPAASQLSAPSADVVWVLMVDQYLYRSADGGASWEQRPVPASAGSLILQISFLSDREGWLMAGDSPTAQCHSQPIHVWHTTDAGATWQPFGSKGISDLQCKQALSFVDPKRGFLAGWSQDHTPVIYQTRDGGQTWTGSQSFYPLAYTTPERVGFILEVGRVRAFGSILLVPEFGTMAGSPAFVMMRSTDRGATWNVLWGTGASVAIVSVNRWLIMNGPGLSSEVIAGSLNSGLFFDTDLQAPPIDSDFAFTDPLVGYVDVYGTISKTVDGGSHWTRDIRTPGTAVKPAG
jgi:hypothetical protein